MATNSSPPLYIGTAGWAIPKQCVQDFPGEGTHLERYARGLNAVEINSSFYRDHKPTTYEKWASCAPEDFRFSVKLLGHFTQTQRLKEPGAVLKQVVDGISSLGEKFGVLLVQLPPSLDLNCSIAQDFLAALRNVYSGHIAWEPRHVSWSSSKALELYHKFKITKVEADPEPCPLTPPVHAGGFRYVRWHGSPEIYKSRYAPSTLENLAQSIYKTPIETWVIFDNTTYGFATENALELLRITRQNKANLRPLFSESTPETI